MWITITITKVMTMRATIMIMTTPLDLPNTFAWA
jgi:hypothetical protein